MITSVSNQAVKDTVLWQTKAKARRESGFFVVEGLRLVREAPPEDVFRTYATEAFARSSEGAALCERLGAELVSETVMARMSDTKTPQGILAAVRQKHWRTEDLLERLPEAEVRNGEQAAHGPVLVLEHVQDPGNVGTLFRTAEAAGAAGILMDAETADPWQPKVVRGTMGAIFRLPFAVTEDLPAALSALKAQGVTLYAAHLEGSEEYDRVPYPLRAAFLLGNEGNGLSKEITALADARVRIPMMGQAESLNVSTAGAVLLYEHFRQRRQ